MGDALQMSLFDPNTGIIEKEKSNHNKANFSDPAFASNKKAPIHRWVPWIAGFSREFVQSAFKKYLSEKSTVLDPFSGVGTTLVEAALAGHNTCGFEINPYAALACRVKLHAPKINPDLFEEEIKAFKSFYKKATSNPYVPQAEPPPGFKTRGAFYSPKVIEKVLIVLDFVNAREDLLLRDMFRIAFGATMVTYSNYSYEPSLGRRVSAGKEDIDDYPVGEHIALKLEQMLQDMEWARDKSHYLTASSQIFNESFFHCQQNILPSSADLIVTSPPYLNNYHYNRNTRPHLYWLGFTNSPQDLKKFEEQNFGKFWQTVRDEKKIDLDFEIEDREISICLEELRGKYPEKGNYGGNGWANYAASYFNDCYRFAKVAHYALKKNGTALVVIGNSILQGIMIPTDHFLGRIAEKAGLSLVDIHVPRETRIGNSIIQSGIRVEKAKKAHKLYESVVELRKR